MREEGEVKWWWGQRRLRLTERKREAGVETRGWLRWWRVPPSAA